ncbi:hypothetical protein CAP39_04125 [Sphingomonas sp. IBVSS1]|nr:hypothetical protein CAP39_04125 [Sphingomonas sp. IBVSS1]
MIGSNSFKILQKVLPMRPLDHACLEFKSAEPPWLGTARLLIGTSETAGTASNPIILGWARDLGLAYANDGVSWCGLFIAHVIRTGIPGEALPATPLAARAWSRFGIACPVQPGAVLTFWRGSRASWQGHVGLYVGEDAAAFHILGGNQGDAVNVKRFPRERFLAARWPKTAPPPTGGPRQLRPDGGFSRTEQ